MNTENAIYCLAQGRKILNKGVKKIHKAIKECKWCYFPASELFSDTASDKFIELQLLGHTVQIEEKDLENISLICLKHKV
jgi:phosphoribosyl-dephospho-CoA transferase